MENNVYLVKCPSYEEAAAKMADLLDLMGGLEKYAAAGEKIVMKVNLLQAAAPEKAVTTHPTVVAAASRMAQEIGAQAIIADSPGSGLPYTRRTMERLYRTTAMEQAAAESGAALNADFSHQAVSYPRGKLIKRFEVITPVLEADGVFNLCKLKTHTFMHMTGAVKNNFGVIPGITKPGYHAKLQQKEHFADMLLDLAQFVSPRLSIMDAVVGMEGDGPHAGTPRPVGWLLAATHPLALDVVAGEMMGFDRDQNPVLLAAERRGLGPNRLEDVTLVGADKAELRIAGYKKPATIFDGAGLGPFTRLTPLFKNAGSLQPRIVKDRCVACGSCYESCPVDAITMNSVAHIDEKACIRCYCCHEMCADEAIELKSNWLYRILNR